MTSDDARDLFTDAFDGLLDADSQAAFDAAVLISVLGFAADPASVLREARRVARERVVVLDLSSRSWLGLYRRLLATRGHPIFSRARFLTRGALREHIAAAGLAVERERSALFLPHPLAGRLPRLEERLARRGGPLAGIVGFSCR